MHMLIDGYRQRELRSIGMVELCIKAIVRDAGLTIINGPTWYTLPKYRECWAIVAESHICIKLVHDGQVLMDVFSCNEYSPTMVLEHMENCLGVINPNWRIILRAGTGPGGTQAAIGGLIEGAAWGNATQRSGGALKRLRGLK